MAGNLQIVCVCVCIIVLVDGAVTFSALSILRGRQKSADMFIEPSFKRHIL